MKTLITILARGGSKRLPGKALREVCGKPLIQWTVEQALEADIGDVVVSSDNSEIHSLAGNNVLHLVRDDEMSSDICPKLDAIKWTVNEAETHLTYDTIVDLDICNPLRTNDDIEAALELYSKDRNDTLCSVTKARRNPYYNQLQRRYGGVEKPCFLECLKIFDIEPCPEDENVPVVWDINCNIYIYNREWMEHHKKSPISDKHGIYLMPSWTRWDIDEEDDIPIVEAMMRKYLC
jgi:CMP-N-acetylneuraminic acid synthetase